MHPIVLFLAVAAEHHELFASEAQASSFLVSNWNKFTENYHPSYVLDGDPTTAWVEGKEGNGEGEWLRIETTHLKTARQLKLEIRNGYQKSKNLFNANAMPHEIDVVALGPALEEIAQKRFALEKKQGWQTLLLDLPADRAFGGVELRVVSAHDGRVYKDGCISDVRIHVDSDVRYDAAFEKKKRDTLLKWTKDRKAAAKFFKKLPREYPFASTQLRIATTQDAEAEVDADNDEAKALDAVRAKKIVDDAMFTLVDPATIVEPGRSKKVRVAPIAKTFAPEGGPEALIALLPFVDTSTFAVFESAKDVVKVAKDEWSYSKSVKRTESHVRDDGTLAGVCMVASFETDSEREGGSEDETTCVSFDAQGKAIALAQKRQFGGAMESTTTTMLRLERDENGKISGLDVQQLERSSFAITARREKYSAVPDGKS